MLVLLFTVSMSPKSYFHDLIAHHTDVKGCNEDHRTSVLHKQEIDCDFDNLVVTTPFADYNLVVSIPASPKYFEEGTSFYSYYIHEFFFNEDGRGPPCD